MDEFWGGFVAGAIVAVAVSILISLAAIDGNYRQGQIDALNGEVYYHLQEQPDGAVIWVSCEGVCAR